MKSFIEYQNENNGNFLATLAEIKGMSEYTCPFCKGRAYRGDPGSDMKFRGGAKCVDCKQTFSAIKMKPRIERNDIVK